MIFIYLLLILVLLIDLLLYIPLKFHTYQDGACFYVYFFSLPIIKIDYKSNYNLLKNKVSVDKVVDTSKDDLKIVESFKIEKIYIRIDKNIALNYAHILYPLLSINNIINIIDYNCISFKLSNIIFKIIKIRRNNSERTSN